MAAFADGDIHGNEKFSLAGRANNEFHAYYNNWLASEQRKRSEHVSRWERDGYRYREIEGERVCGIAWNCFALHRFTQWIMDNSWFIFMSCGLHTHTHSHSQHTHMQCCNACAGRNDWRPWYVSSAPQRARQVSRIVHCSVSVCVSLSLSVCVCEFVSTWPLRRSSTV